LDFLQLEMLQQVNRNWTRRR